MVGRETELATLEAEWAQAVAGTPRSVLLVGDPGIGKSRLLYEFQRRHASDECVRIIVQCSAEYQDTAFQPIASELTRVFGIEPIDSRDVRLRKVTEALQRLGIVSPEVPGALNLVFADDSGDAELRARPAVQEAGAGAPTARMLAGVPSRRWPTTSPPLRTASLWC